MALRYEGCAHFRQRLVCATLAGKRVVITKIRENSTEPGLRDYEASFLRLLEKVTNGCRIEIGLTGTAITYTPGILTGHPKVQHNCGTTRGIGYFLEPLLSLLPFAKFASTIELIGVTNDVHTRSVDLLRTVTLPAISKSFGIPVDGMQLKIKKRGAPPLGGGLVEFSCPIVPKIASLTLLDPGLVRRVRGIAYCARVSPQVSNRLRESARAILNDFVKDVFIYTDHYKGDEAGASPGYALSLVAETTTGCLIGAEAVGAEGSIPEEVGSQAVTRLLEEIAGRGCVDMPSQSVFLLFMCLTSSDVSQVRLGPITQYSVHTLRLLKDFFGVEFQFEEEEEGEGGGLVARCVGSGFVNIARKMK